MDTRRLHFNWDDLPVLIEKGMSLREIARFKGATHSSVRKAIKRMNIPYVFNRVETMRRVAQRDNLAEKMKGNTFSAKEGYVGDIIFKCDFCEDEFTNLFSESKNYKHHFCSKSCRAKWVAQNVTQTLEYKEKKRKINIERHILPPKTKKGKDHWNWKGGISKISRGSDGRYIQWRKSVLAKDNYTCIICGGRGGELSAHHIREWHSHPELRYDINNGQCMHYNCHMEFHGLVKKTT